MPFLTGKVTFSRFKVLGGSPKRLDEQCLEKFRAHRIGHSDAARNLREDIGWLGGRHLLDREFDIEKNIILDCLHFGLRIDNHRIPPDLFRAYYEMEFEALLKEDGNGASNKYGRLKKEARAAAERRADAEIREGRYRRQRQFPILWDTRRDVLYAAATQPAVHERLHPLFKESFGKRLEPVTAGSLAAEWAERNGVSRRAESCQPSRFIPHPGGNGHIDVYWTAHNPAQTDYLGNEFLLWLWYRLAEEGDTLHLADDTDASFVIVNQLVLECPWAETGKETIVCEGPAQLPESRRAIQAGKLPRKAGLIVHRQGDQYEFTLQAETFNVSAAALPKPDQNGNGNGNRGGNGRAHVEERIEQIRHLTDTIDLLYGAFLTRRFADTWDDDRTKITQWLRQET